MLALAKFCKGTSPAMNTVARESALEFAAASYPPAVVVEHIPGAAKVSPEGSAGHAVGDATVLAGDGRPLPPLKQLYPELVPASDSLAAAGDTGARG